MGIFHRLRHKQLFRNRSLKELGVIAALAIPVLFLFSELDLFDRFYLYSRAHEDWELDEIAALSVYFLVAAAVFALRRYGDMRKEMKLRIAAENEAKRMARHDTLTGLANRRRFKGEFETRKSRSGPMTELAAFVVDLDRFKPVNDSHGHETGDYVLREVAKRLTELAGDKGVAARLGGDEFGILIDCTDDHDHIVRLARRICREMAKPIETPSVTVSIGASIGIALYPDNAGDLDTLLRQADTAMYNAKRDSRGAFHFFSPEMDRQLTDRMALERDLRKAIKDGQIVPYYHPLVELTSGKTIGFEILARWEHPEFGVIQPDAFIPLAENSGMITPMTYNLLERACREARDWPDSPTLSLNVSPQQLTDPWLPQEILRILTENKYPPERLEVEITENALVDNLEQVKSTLHSFHNLGIRVALDDFGTGYSGLYHLRELELDTLKIDRSFTSEMLAGEEQARLVEAIIGLGNALGLDTTAEGIEFPEVRNRLGELGCHLGQGFFYGEPRPAKEIEREFKTANESKKSA